MSYLDRNTVTICQCGGKVTIKMFCQLSLDVTVHFEAVIFESPNLHLVTVLAEFKL